MPDQNIAEIEILVEKLHNQTISKPELRRLEEWYIHTEENPLVWDLREGSRSVLREEMLTTIRSNFSTKQSRLRPYLRYAAAAVVFFMLAAVLFLFQYRSIFFRNAMITFNSEVGKIIRVNLPDSSIVWLKGKSQLQYPEAFDDSTRNVLLSGEALFEVAKDKKHPFIIKTSHYFTRVLGTSFNIIESKKAFKLTVLTGRVAVFALARKNESLKQDPPVIITPGKELEASDKLSFPRVVLAKSDFRTNILMGTEYDMAFSNTPFVNVKERIEKKFNVTVTSRDDAYQGCVISADLTDQSLENTISLVAAALNAKYTKIDNKLTFIGGGCN